MINSGVAAPGLGKKGKGKWKGWILGGGTREAMLGYS